MSNKRIDINTSLVRKDDIPTTDIDGELGMMSIEKGKYFTLDEIGARIWKLLETPNTVNKVVEVLMQEYDIDYETCTSDVIELLEKLLQEDLVAI